MRTVSNCQIISPDPESYAVVLGIMEGWAAEKFDETKIIPAIKRSEKNAIFTRQDDIHEDINRRIYQTEEEIEGGNLQTSLTIIGSKDATAILCSQAIISRALVPPQVQIALPRFIREIIQHCPGCTASPGGDRLFRQVFQVNDRGIGEFGDLIFASERSLPVIAISELDGKPLTRDFPERLADRSAGLAHVCLLTHQASWDLTARYGKEWSVYNGAVKLYWPRANPDTSGKRHPLWTYDRLAERHSNDREAATWLSQHLVEVVLEASASVAVDRVFADFERDLSRSHVEQRIAAASGSSDFQALAEVYAADNDKLKGQIDGLKEEVRELKEKLRLSFIGERAKELTAGEGAEEAPPSTVTEAVEAARRAFGDHLVFPDQLDDNLATLNYSAGPPEKIFRYLKSLDEYARLSASGKSLGKNVDKWLEDRNVVCSTESLTTSGNKKEQESRTWSVGGERVTCNLHLKPNDGTSPDRCVRIYFVPAKNGKVKIGYIGRHL